VAGNRIFDVEIEGTVVLDDYEVFAEVGCDVGVMKTFIVTSTDGTLDIRFPLVNNRPAMVSAIEIAESGADSRTATVSIEHTGSNETLAVLLTGEATPGGSLPNTSKRGEDFDGLTEHADLPNQFELVGNYPNPFNPSTNVVFDVPEAANVNLHVFDLLGRRVATLLSGQVEAGRHQVRWNGSTEAGGNVSSGVYLLRMESGTFNATRTIILMK